MILISVRGHLPALCLELLAKHHPYNYHVRTFGISFELEHDTTFFFTPFIFKANKFATQLCFFSCICHRCKLERKKKKKVLSSKKMIRSIKSNGCMNIEQSC